MTRDRSEAVGGAMTKTMALVHTVGEVVPTFKALCAEIVPDVTCFHVLDEGIIRTFSPEGEITPRTVRRLAEVVVLAQGSMASALDDWPQAEWPCPILTNARLGLERASEILKTAAE